MLLLHKWTKKSQKLQECMCDLLQEYIENVLFLKQIETDNEKWILYDNVEGKSL